MTCCSPPLPLSRRLMNVGLAFAELPAHLCLHRGAHPQPPAAGASARSRRMGPEPYLFRALGRAPQVHLPLTVRFARPVGRASMSCSSRSGGPGGVAAAGARRAGGAAAGRLRRRPLRRALRRPAQVRRRHQRAQSGERLLNAAFWAWAVALRKHRMRGSVSYTRPLDSTRRALGQRQRAYEVDRRRRAHAVVAKACRRPSGPPPNLTSCFRSSLDLSLARAHTHTRAGDAVGLGGSPIQATGQGRRRRPAPGQATEPVCHAMWC